METNLESDPSPSTIPPPQPEAPLAPNTSQPKMSTDDRKPRTLVLCFDGTANQFDGDNTNIVKFYALLDKDCTDDQLCYYQPGIGTYFQPGVVSPLFQWGAKILDEAFAWYLDAHVRGGYQFLMQNWHPGDKICIFGFSRGAYTARALAGMLHKIGLLPKDNPEQVPFAYKLFKQTDATSVTIAQGFKQTFCRAVTIEFVGVWDTVASVGVLTGRSLPFTTTNTTIKTFRHALSLDEHRVKFMPNLYHRPTPSVESAKKDSEHASAVVGHPGEKRNSKSKLKASITKLSPANSLRRASKTFGSLSRKDYTSKITDPSSNLACKVTPPSNVGNVGSVPSVKLNQFDDEIEGGTDVLEVWFSGCHSDVGGGAVSNTTDHSLADISLRWMVRQVVLSQCGITFDSAALLRANMPDSIFRGVGFALCAPLSHKRSRSPGLVPHSEGSNSKEHHSLDELRNPSVHEGQSPNYLEVPSTPLAIDSDPFASPKSKARAVAIEEIQIKVDASGHQRDTSDGGDSTLTDIDELQPIHDQLKILPVWWILELVPLTWNCQDAEGNWHQKFGFHLGKGRPIPDEHPIFHESVKERMEDSALKYTPRAIWTKGSETYTD